MKKILVTGGAGFIGSNFVNTNQDKYEITVLDNLMMGDPMNIYNLNKSKLVSDVVKHIEETDKIILL